MDIKKIDETTVEITTTQTKRVDLDSLQRQSALLGQNIAFYQSQKDGIDAQIKQIQGLGVITKVEQIQLQKAEELSTISTIEHR